MTVIVTKHCSLHIVRRVFIVKEQLSPSVGKSVIRLENMSTCWRSVLQVAENFVPPLLEAVLIDYQRNVPAAREPEVLSTMATIVNKLGVHITGEIPKIFDAVFECTLNMINKVCMNTHNVWDWGSGGSLFIPTWMLNDTLTAKCFTSLLIRILKNSLNTELISSTSSKRPPPNASLPSCPSPPPSSSWSWTPSSGPSSTPWGTWPTQVWRHFQSVSQDQNSEH